MRRVTAILITASLIAGAITLSIGRSIEQRSRDAALFDAVYQDDFPVAHRLLRLGASPNADGCKWQDIAPTWFARISGRVLGRSPARCSEKNRVSVLALPALYRPSTDPTLLVELLKRGANPNPEAEATDQSPLCTAIELGNLEAAKQLIANGANPNIVFEDGKTALTETFAYSFPLEYYSPTATEKLVRMLMAHGANLTLPNARNPLCAAVQSEFQTRPFVDLLLDRGAKINGAFYAGETPLMSATHYLNEDMAKYLIVRGADVNAVDENGSTALHRAAGWGNLEMTQLLLANGANPALQDNMGRTAIDEAKSAWPHSPEVVRILEAAAKRR